MAPRLGLGGGVTADPASGLFASTPLLLDTYPNAHRAYSVRKLRTEYTGYAMKVRESGNDYTADVAFDDDGLVSASSKVYNPTGGVSDGDALSTFMSMNNGFVTTWYDQSGEGSNATQSSAPAQPKIWDSSGGLNTEGSPARAALLFDGSNDYLTVSPVGLSLGSTTIFSVMSHGSGTVNGVWTLSFSSGVYVMHYVQSSEDQYWYENGDVASHYPVNTSQTLFSYTSGSGTDKQILYANGTPSSEKGDSTATTSFYNDSYNGLGTLYNYSLHYPGEFQEFIVYDSDQSSNLSDIESDITTAFDIS